MALREQLLQSVVAELPLRPAMTVLPETTVRQAANRMARADMCCVFVVNRSGLPLGRLTQREVVRLLADDPTNLDQRVAEHMEPVDHTVRDQDPVERVIDQMHSTELGHVCIVNAGGRVVALASYDDLMSFVAERIPRRACTHDHGIERFLSTRKGA